LSFETITVLCLLTANGSAMQTNDSRHQSRFLPCRTESYLAMPSSTSIPRSAS
jgi:hypothetical protein